MSTCDEGEERRLCVATFFLWQNAFFVRYTLVSRGRSDYEWNRIRILSQIMKYGFVKQLLLFSSPTVVRDVSLGRSRGYCNERNGLRMMRVLV